MKKLVCVFAAPDEKRSAKAFFDSELQEFVVKLYLKDTWQPEADYFTDDKADAIETCKVMALVGA